MFSYKIQKPLSKWGIKLHHIPLLLYLPSHQLWQKPAWASIPTWHSAETGLFAGVHQILQVFLFWAVESLENPVSQHISSMLSSTFRHLKRRVQKYNFISFSILAKCHFSNFQDSALKWSVLSEGFWVHKVTLNQWYRSVTCGYQYFQESR